MRQFAAGKIAVDTDYTSGIVPLSITLTCPDGKALLLRRARVSVHVNTGLSLNSLGVSTYQIERLRDGEVLTSARYPLLGYGAKGARDDIEVIRINAVNDLEGLTGTDLRVRFDTKAACEAQVILLQYECIDPANAPYTAY